MIILDTNIVSELMKEEPNQHVFTWINQQVASQLFLTSITIAEIWHGLSLLPKGKRRARLEDAFSDSISIAFSQRILSFDQKAANRYGAMMAEQQLSGKNTSTLDGQIAAITFSNHATLATHNTKDFRCFDIKVIDPFI